MKSYLSRFVIILLLAILCSHLPIHVSSAAAPSKLDEVCNKIADLKQFEVTLDHCRSVFQRDPRSFTSPDNKSLALILLNITMKSATEAISGMSHAILHAEKSLNPEEMRAGIACVHRYEPAVPSLQAMVKSIKVGEYEKARDEKFDAREADSNCEDEVKADEDLGVTPYIDEYRVKYTQAVYVLDAMAELLVKTYCAHS